MRDHFIKRLTELASADRNVILMTGDLGFGVFDQFRAKLSAQFINAGVAEQNMTAMATGMAMEGKVVFTYSIANFPTLRCLEQIRNDACYHGANVKVVSIGGGFSYGALGISHHATEDLAIMRSLPDLLVLSPCGLWETMEATTAIVKHDGACYLRLDKSHGDDSPRSGEVFEIGKARVLREGADVSVFVCGGILKEVQCAADILAARGIGVRIISMHTVKPLDGKSLEVAVRETGGVVTVEEHSIHGGLGGAVAEYLMDSGLRPKKFKRIALTDGFSSIVGSQEYLRARYGLDAQHIADKIAATLSM